MSTFRYKGKFNEDLNGVKCDACGFKLYANIEGQLFGEHMRIAKAEGWLITKEHNKWLNLCPKCKQALEEKRRQEWLNRMRRAKE